MLSRVAIRRIAERVCLWEFMGVLLAGWACGSATARGELPLGWYADPLGTQERPTYLSRVDTPAGSAIAYSTDVGNLYQWDGVGLELIASDPLLAPLSNFAEWLDDGSGPAYYVGTSDRLLRVGEAGVLSTIHPRGVSNVVFFDSGTGLAPHFSGINGLFRLQQGVKTTLASWNAQCLPAPMVPYDDGDGLALHVAGSFRWLTPPGSDRIRVNGLARLQNGAWSPLGSGLSGPGEWCTVPAAFSLTTFPIADQIPLVIGGDFSGVNSVASPGLAFLLQGNIVLPGITSSLVTVAQVIDFGNGPTLFVAGLFERADGSPFEGFMLHDGSSWIEFSRANVVSGGFYSPTVFDTARGRHLYLVGVRMQIDSTFALWSARYGPICPDLDGSGTVDLADLAVVLADFGGRTDADDSDNDGDMDLHDLALVLAGFGQSCTR